MSKYHLKAGDNFHHGDESGSNDFGGHKTYEGAAAKAVVNQSLEIQTLYQHAIKFAAMRHEEKKQKVKGTELPYVVHLSNVAMEIFVAARSTCDFNLAYAVQMSLLHDTIEDTATTFEEITEHFGEDIAVGVLALSKDDKLPKGRQISDSLARIKKLPFEVWAVKLADRITNLQPPPKNWSVDKISQYLEDSVIILSELKDGNAYLAKRLEAKIGEYRNMNKETLIDKA